MAKIIEHNFRKKTGRAGRDLLAGSYGCFMQTSGDMRQLLGEMVMQARLFLEQEGMDPRDFILSETYMKEYLLTDLRDETARQDNYAELVYVNCMDQRTVAVCQFAVPDGDGLLISYQMYSLDTADNPDKRWKLYNFHSRCWMEDEDDCFDLKLLQYEYGLFQSQKKD